MYALGRQVLVEFYNCPTDLLNNAEVVREILLEGTRRSGASIVSDTFHTFSPHGVSGVIVIAESHVSIHTWPEYNYAAVDIFTCGDTIDPWVAQIYLKDHLHAETTSVMELKRGMFSEKVSHKPDTVTQN